MFYEKELQKTNQEFRKEKVIKKKGNKLYVNGKVIIIYLIAGLIKKILHKMSQYFPKPYNHFGGNVKAELDLSNYATKTDVKGATGIDMSRLALRSNLKVNSICTSGFVLKTKYDTDKLDLENRIPT